VQSLGDYGHKVLGEASDHEERLETIIKAKDSTWIETLKMALPMKAALKNVVNGTKK
jgi:hypothetical protein